MFRPGTNTKAYLGFGTNINITLLILDTKTYFAVTHFFCLMTEAKYVSRWMLPNVFMDTYMYVLHSEQVLNIDRNANKEADRGILHSGCSYSQ